ncbi:hypothetical protein ACWCOZ_27400 [Streptomyces sp. NPDC001840]|uniref:hypothetical protein n=1 Tax=Streptomyces sp. NPDC059396 TaxID=3346819 RepID=UPI0036B59DF0
MTVTDRNPDGAVLGNLDNGKESGRGLQLVADPETCLRPRAWLPNRVTPSPKTLNHTFRNLIAAAEQLIPPAAHEQIGRITSGDAAVEVLDLAGNAQ